MQQDYTWFWVQSSLSSPKDVSCMLHAACAGEDLCLRRPRMPCQLVFPLVRHHPPGGCCSLRRAWYWLRAAHVQKSLVSLRHVSAFARMLRTGRRQRKRGAATKGKYHQLKSLQISDHGSNVFEPAPLPWECSDTGICCT